MSQEPPANPDPRPDEQRHDADQTRVQDDEPTQAIPPHTEEPTRSLPQRDHQDTEPTQAIPPHTDEPTQVFPGPGHDDPEPTIAMPPTAEERPYRAPAYEAQPRTTRDTSDYVRLPVFSPTGFDQPGGDPDAGPGTPGPDAGPAAEEQDDARAREAEAARRREAAEAARQRSLGTIIPGDDGGEVTRTVPARRTTDKWFGSLGLIVLRWVLAAILAIRGYQMITDIPGTRDLLSQIGMPYLEYFPWALAIAHGLAALGLVFGLGVRVIGVCVAALGVCVLALVKWGMVPIFQSDMPGFVGELEVLVTAVGFTLFTLGSGGWGMDAGLRHNRQREKYGQG